MRDDVEGHYREGWHYIHLGRMGYGSNLDGCDANFKLCDKCLCEFVQTFVHKENIYNSGSNSYIDDGEENY